MFAQDLKVSCRSLLRRPSLSLGVVLTLALGIGATTAVYSVVDGVVLRPLPYENASRLVTVGSLAPGSSGVDPETGLHDLSIMTSVDYDRLVEQAQSFEQMTTFGTARVLVTDQNGLQDFVTGASVGPEFFGMVGTSPALGRTFLTEEFEFPEELDGLFGNAALITHEYWQRRYGGDPDILGRPLEADVAGAAAALVVGILPEGFHPPEPFFGPDDPPHIYTPMRLPSSEGPVRRVRSGIRGLALLRPSVSIDAARAEVARIAEDAGDPLPGAVSSGAERRSLGVNSLHAETIGTAAPTLWIFLGAAALLLALAAMNAASLLLSRVLDRLHELGVRAALGAGLGRLLRLLLYEAAILTLAGATVGVLAAHLGVDAFHRFAPLSIPRMSSVAVDARVLSVAAIASLVTGLASGLVPALRLTRRDPWQSLRSGGRSLSDSGSSLRSTLVGGQLALAVMLLAGAGLLFGSFLRLRTADPGVDPEGLIAMRATPVRGVRVTTEDIASLWRRWDPILAELGAVPGAYAVAGASALPFQAPSWAPRTLLAGDDPETVREGVAGYVVTPGYFEVVGTEVLAGRGFLPSDGPDGERVVIVNEAFVRSQMGGEDPLDAILRRMTEGLGTSGEIVPMRIVGVVRDVVQARVEDGARPAIYVPYTQADPQQLLGWKQVIRADLETAAMIPDVRSRLSEMGQIPAELGTMEDRMARSRTTPRFQAMLIGAFSAVAVLLAALGLYGSLTETVRRLRRELGIRMALGADSQALIRLVAGQGMKVTVAGLAVGLLGTVALSRVLAGFLFGVEPHDPLILMLVSGVLLSVAGIACLVPARRATMLDPVQVLNAD